MDRQLLERLIGAGVLVVALVIIVPAILDGESDDEGADGREDAASIDNNEPRRTHTIRLDRPTESPPVARVVTPSPEAGAGARADGTGVRPEAENTGPSSDTGSVTETVVQSPTVKPEIKNRPPPEPVRAADPPPVSVSQSGWAVQLGSFSSRQNAQRLADEVGGRGFPVFLMTVDQSGKKLYRVRVGPRESRAQAAELAERLRKAGYSGQVIQ